MIEPHPDVRALIELVIRRLGHEPVREISSEVDAAVIEPAADPRLEVSRALRDRGARLVFASIFPAEQEAIDLEPVAYLIKPFALRRLERVLEQALAVTSRRG